MKWSFFILLLIINVFAIGCQSSAAPKRSFGVDLSDKEIAARAARDPFPRAGTPLPPIAEPVAAPIPSAETNVFVQHSPPSIGQGYASVGTTNPLSQGYSTPYGAEHYAAGSYQGNSPAFPMNPGPAAAQVATNRPSWR